MGKPTIEIPDVPKAWNDTSNDPSGDANTDQSGLQNLVLPNGQRLQDVIKQRRADLLDTVGRLQNDPESLDGGLGYAAGHYWGMAWPRGPIDFKNQFKGQGDADQLGKAGNFAYYAIGSGILPEAVLDAGAAMYNIFFKKMDPKQPADVTNRFGPDTSARSIRDSALEYGAGLK